MNKTKEIQRVLAEVRAWMTNDDPYATELICDVVEPGLAKVLGCTCDAHTHERCAQCRPTPTGKAKAS